MDVMKKAEKQKLATMEKAKKQESQGNMFNRHKKEQMHN